MSYLVFHKACRQPTCGKRVNFLERSFFRSHSTEFSLGLFTGFATEKTSHPGFFLGFNNTTNTTIGKY